MPDTSEWSTCVSNWNTPGNATPQHLDPTRYSLHLLSTITRI